MTSAFRVLSGQRLVAECEPLPSAEVAYENDWLRIESDPALTTRVDLEEGHQIFLVGWVIGYQGPAGLCRLDDLSQWLRANATTDVDRWVDSLEGRFMVIGLDRDGSCRVRADRFGKLDVYVQDAHGGIALGSDLETLPMNPASAGFDQVGLAHTITYYGYRPPKKHTIYAGVSRLGIGQTAAVDRGSLKLDQRDFEPRKTLTEFGHEQLETYTDAFLGHLEAAGSAAGNLLYLSSGWDSTGILAGLIEVFGPSQVSGLIGRMLYSERSGECNKFEVERAQRFSRHYGVPLEVVDLDYARLGEEQFEQARPYLKKHHFYSFTGVNHFVFAEAANRRGAGEAVFAGEISDGAHNLGFSQYATIFHPSHDFREYADKMASYLFGPTFARRILGGDFEGDPIFTLFRSLDPNSQYDPPQASHEDRLRQLFQSFFLRNGRRPFWSGANVRALTPNGLDRYTSEMTSTYLGGTETSDPEELYSWYLHLYNSFHWQGATVATLQASADLHGLRAHLPFWDANLQSLLGVMPESAGRGLDFNRTKFPLKHMLENKLDYPMEFQTGPHAYTYDVQHDFNHNFELLYHSALAEGARALLGRREYHEVLSPDVFDLSYIDGLVESYLGGEPLAGLDRETLVAIYLICQIGWYS